MRTPQNIRELTTQLQRTVRRIKREINYRGSQLTEDVVSMLLTKWLASGELDRLLALAGDRRSVTHSVRTMLIDVVKKKGSRKRRGFKVAINDAMLMSDDDLYDRVERVQLRRWLHREVGLLENGQLDVSMKVALASPVQTGQILRWCMRGLSYREIAEKMKLSVGTVSNRHASGIMYLSLKANKCHLRSLRVEGAAS